MLIRCVVVPALSNAVRIRAQKDLDLLFRDVREVAIEGQVQLLLTQDVGTVQERVNVDLMNERLAQKRT